MPTTDLTRPRSGGAPPDVPDDELVAGGDPYECPACVADGVECEFHRGWAAGWDACAALVARMVDDHEAGEGVVSAARDSRDEACPRCDYPTTYVDRDPATGRVEAEGCPHCGWWQYRSPLIDGGVGAMTARQRLPRRKVVSYGERRRIVRPGARYGFVVDVLSCGHEVYFDDRQPKTRGCPYCPEGLPPGFHPRALRGGES